MNTTIIELNSEKTLGRPPLKWTGRTAKTIIRRVWGKRAFFHQDSGLPSGYGQIFMELPNRGSGFSATSITGMVRIEKEE